MKFSTLKPTHRSALAALANSGVLRTDKLARCMEGITPASAAHELCALRKTGLIFSHQKTGADTYCNWEISSVGRAVFEGRPDQSLVMKSEDKVQSQVGGTPPHYAVIKSPAAGIETTSSQSDAIAAASQAALENGYPYIVIRLVADVTPPPLPTATVALL
jgi:hypothetical protein